MAGEAPVLHNGTVRETSQSPRAYVASPELERRLNDEREVQLAGGSYRATVARAGRWYEAWTDELPFAYGRPSATLEDALDSLHEEWLRLRAARPSPPAG